MRVIPRRVVGTVGLAAVQFGLAAISAAIPANAATTLRHGWWSQASVVSGVAVTPPDVPADGLYIEGSPAGPLAMSAVDVQVGMGQQIESLTLVVAGTPVISGPPIACELTSDFVAVQAGAWSDAPRYDCSTQVVGQVDADQTHVKFDVRKLSRDGRVRMALLTVNQADRIAFQAPSATDLSLKSQEVAAVTAPSPNSHLSVPTTPVQAPEPGPLAQLPANPLAVGQSPASDPTAQVVAPELASAGQPQGRPDATRVVTAASTRSSHRLATGLGLGLLLLCICYWADGFGSVSIRRRLAQIDIEGNTQRPLERLEQLAIAAGGSPRE